MRAGTIATDLADLTGRVVDLEDNPSGGGGFTGDPPPPSAENVGLVWYTDDGPVRSNGTTWLQWEPEGPSALRAPIWLPADMWRREDAPATTSVLLGRTVIDVEDANRFLICDEVPGRFDLWTSYDVTLHLTAKSAATGVVRWQYMEALRLAAGVDLGAMAGAATTVMNVTISGPVNQLVTATFGGAIAPPEGDGPVRLRLARLGANAADTLADAVSLVGVYLTHVDI